MVLGYLKCSKGKKGELITFVQAPSTGDNNLALDSDWFVKYTSTELRVLYDCCFAYVGSDENISMLWCPTIQMVLQQ